MVDDFSYINARIRGLSGRLLSGAQIRDLSAQPDLDATVSLLRDTTYGPALQSCLSGKPGIEGVEEGLRENHEETFFRLLHFSSGTAGDLIGIALGRWETNCLKALLRGKVRQGTPQETISACLPVGFFSSAVVREMASQEDAGRVIDLLRLWGYRPARRLQKAWRERSPGDDLQLLEIAIDRAYFDGAHSRLVEIGPAGEGLGSFLRLEVDITNVLILLRLLHARSPAAESTIFFLEGGRLISRDSFLDLGSRGTVAAAAAGLGDSPLGVIFRETLSAYRSTGRPSLFEHASTRLLRSEALRLARHEPLGAGLAVGFIWAKVNEVSLLRLICRAKHRGLPRRDLEAELALFTR